MITVHVEAPYASFRKSYARSFAETYPFPPPATVYGMLLSLVGESFRVRHEGVRLAFAYARQPRVATVLRKLSRYKYGVPAKQEKLGNAPVYVEVLCGIEMLCWVDSSEERDRGRRTLEERIMEAIQRPEEVERTGLVYLGLSDDAVDDVSLWNGGGESWRWLSPRSDGPIELPVWVDHVGSLLTRWRRFCFKMEDHVSGQKPPADRFVEIVRP